jgi:hypothetical protein
MRRGMIGLRASMSLPRDEHADGKLASVSVNQIIAFKKTALRRHVWYRVLSRVERGVLDLTTRYVVRIRSLKLANVVSAILSKLEFAVESMVDRLVRTVGFSLARKISDLAKRLGNRLAHGWAGDAGFARFLAVMQFNAGRGG